MQPSPPPVANTRLKRSLRTSGGFLLLVAGIPMLVMPGPGMPIIFFGLNLLAVDYPWAKRLLGRMRGALDELQRRLPRRGGIERARSAASGLSRRLVRRRSTGAGGGVPGPTASLTTRRATDVTANAAPGSASDAPGEAPPGT